MSVNMHLESNLSTLVFKGRLMANGNVPYCGTCTHFEFGRRGESPPSHIRAQDADCRCNLHKVHLPFHQTAKLLICSRWQDYRGSVVGDQWKDTVSNLYKNDEFLYCFSNEYSFDVEVYAKLDELPRQE